MGVGVGAPDGTAVGVGVGRGWRSGSGLGWASARRSGSASGSGSGWGLESGSGSGWPSGSGPPWCSRRRWRSVQRSEPRWAPRWGLRWGGARRRGRAWGWRRGGRRDGDRRVDEGDRQRDRATGLAVLDGVHAGAVLPDLRAVDDGALDHVRGARIDERGVIADRERQVGRVRDRSDLARDDRPGLELDERSERDGRRVQLGAGRGHDRARRSPGGRGQRRQGQAIPLVGPPVMTGSPTAFCHVVVPSTMLAYRP